MSKLQNIEVIEATANRWETRLFRAANALQKIRQQHKRALAKIKAEAEAKKAAKAAKLMKA